MYYRITNEINILLLRTIVLLIILYTFISLIIRWNNLLLIAYNNDNITIYFLEFHKFQEIPSGDHVIHESKYLNTCRSIFELRSTYAIKGTEKDDPCKYEKRVIANNLISM